MTAVPPGSPPSLTAIVACRNAAPTLARLLDHLARSGADVVLIDNSSTDDTRAIADSRHGNPVVEILDAPYRGYFDLGLQLRLKRDVIRRIGDGWILHADADEFVDAPGELPLRDYLAFWNDSEAVAFDCDEALFLPRSEGECHDPARFETTMRHYLPFRERNRKQRLFRAFAPLDLWLYTGGHVVTEHPERIAPVTLRLRHYLGLSLDQIRSEYLSRVFAPTDLARFWHGSRMGAARYDVVAPPPDVLHSLDNGWCRGMHRNRLPIFAERQPRLRDSTLQNGPADLALLAVSDNAADAVARRLADDLPGLRITRDPGDASLPVLNVLEHPACTAPDGQELRRLHAERWLRQIACARQASLAAGARYAEARLEDVATDPELPGRLVRRLLVDAPGHYGFGFVDARFAALHTQTHYTDPVAAVAGALARDLGYA